MKGFSSFIALFLSGLLLAGCDQGSEPGSDPSAVETRSSQDSRRGSTGDTSGRPRFNAGDMMERKGPKKLCGRVVVHSMGQQIGVAFDGKKSASCKSDMSDGVADLVFTLSMERALEEELAFKSSRAKLVKRDKGLVVNAPGRPPLVLRIQEDKLSHEPSESRVHVGYGLAMNAGTWDWPSGQSENFFREMGVAYLFDTLSARQQTTIRGSAAFSRDVFRFSSAEECQSGGPGSREATIECDMDGRDSGGTTCREGYYACCNCERSTGHEAKCSCKPSEGEDEEHTASLPMLGTTKPRLVSDASRFGEDFGSRVLSSSPCSSKPSPHATLVKQRGRKAKGFSGLSAERIAVAP